MFKCTAVFDAHHLKLQNCFHNADITKYGEVSLMSPNAALKLAYAFLLENNVNPKDIVNIIAGYIGCNTCTIKTRNKEPERYDTITPQPTDDDANDTDEDSEPFEVQQCSGASFVFDKSTMIVFYPKLIEFIDNGISNIHIKMIQRDCAQRESMDAGLWYQCGVIAVPKQYSNKNQIDKNTFASLKRFAGFDTTLMDKGFIFYYLEWQRQLSKRADKTGDFLHFCKNHYSKKIKLTDSKENMKKYFIDKNDSIDIKIAKKDDNDNELQYCMYFTKNGNFEHYFGKNDPNISTHDYDHGKIPLDFQEFEYYFSFGCPICDCENSEGFAYQIALD